MISVTGKRGSNSSGAEIIILSSHSDKLLGYPGPYSMANRGEKVNG
jgi:hypothetical protein